MHSYLRLYITRDDYFNKFHTEIEKRRNILINKGFSAKKALKELKRQAWRILKTF